MRRLTTFLLVLLGMTGEGFGAQRHVLVAHLADQVGLGEVTARAALHRFFDLERLDIRAARELKQSDMASALSDLGPTVVPQLIDALRDEDDAVSSTAGWALGNIGHDAREAIPALIAILDDPERKIVHRDLLLSLTRIVDRKSDDAVRPFVAVLQDVSSEETDRRYALRGLHNIGHAARKAEPDILRMLDSPALAIDAAEAAEAIGSESPRPIEALTAALSGRELDAAAYVIRAYGRRAKASIPALLKLAREGEGDRQVIAIDTLAEVVDASSDAIIGDLLPLLKHESAYVRAGAAKTLGRIGPRAKRAVPALIALMQDLVKVPARSPATGQVIEALGRIGPDARSAVPALIPMLSERQAVFVEDNSTIPSLSVAALGRIGPAAKDAVPAILKAASTEAAGREALFAEALARMGPDAVIPVFVRTMDAVYDKPEKLDQNVANVITATTRKLGDQAIPRLLAMADERSVSKTVICVSLLRELGAGAVARALQSDKVILRYAATVQLQKMGKKATTAVPALQKVSRSDPDPSVREAASAALKKIRN